MARMPPETATTGWTGSGTGLTVNGTGWTGTFTCRLNMPVVGAPGARIPQPVLGRRVLEGKL